ncbi:MAG TPA: hypothetical protein VIT65_18780 [Microlunatus sp.]
MTATHRHADGVTFGIKGFTDATIGPDTASEDEDTKRGDPYVIATLVWTNNCTAEVEMIPLVTARSGPDGTEAPRVYVDEARDSPSSNPAPRRITTSGDRPAEQRQAVTIEITDPVDPSRAVTFTGAIG